MAWGTEYLELGIFASAMVGGLFGFLVYNYNPAKVFMGDTGSLFLGGAISALTFAFDMPLVLITLGIIFIIETLSDIIQVGYFKLSHGSVCFAWRHYIIILSWGAGPEKSGRKKNCFSCLQAYHCYLRSYPL